MLTAAHLAALTGVDSIVEARGHVTTDFTQEHHSVDFYTVKTFTIIIIFMDLVFTQSLVFHTRDAALGGCRRAARLVALSSAFGRRRGSDVHHHPHGPAGQRGAGQGWHWGGRRGRQVPPAGTGAQAGVRTGA